MCTTTSLSVCIFLRYLRCSVEMLMKFQPQIFHIHQTDTSLPQLQISRPTRTSRKVRVLPNQSWFMDCLTGMIVRL